MASSLSGIWCHNDLKSITTSPTGQINEKTAVGRFLIDFIKIQDISNILDIGTWNGLGSTKCFLTALKDKTYNSFISIECNKDKHLIAIRNLSSLIKENDKLLWGSIVKADEINIDRVYEIFPAFKDNTEFQRWHSIDIKNIEISPYIFDELPEKIDVVLFDGGEFTTYFEFEKIFSMCNRFIFLDDCNVDKCMRIRNYLKSLENWKEFVYIPERNGFCGFIKID